ncbi:MAG: hypothetical protein ACI4NJ_05050 [Cellvibrio sp.]
MKDDDFLSGNEQRKKGILKYILRNGVLTFALPVAIIMAFVSQNFKQGVTLQKLLNYCFGWLLAGIFYGASLWCLGEWFYKRKKSTK